MRGKKLEQNPSKYKLGKAICVDKEQASHYINLLKNSNLINEQLKIRQIDDQVCIPLIEEIEKQNFPWIDEISEVEFEVISQRPSSLKEALLELSEDIDEEILQTSFDQIGDIAIIDLKEPLLPYKEKVGEALLMSNPSVKSVYRKVSAVSGKYRTRDLEHMSGIKKTSTIHKEYGISIYVDIKKAYFSPRLSTEHNRVAMKIGDNGPVLDLFAGVAPFGLHLAKNFEIKIDSVDANPYIPDIVKRSIKLNRLKGQINPICMDALAYLEEIKSNSINYKNIIMNHPSGAMNFIDGVIDISTPNTTIYYYIFIPIENWEEQSKDRIKQYGTYLELTNLHKVRQYSPQEYHVCLELIRI